MFIAKLRFIRTMAMLRVKIHNFFIFFLLLGFSHNLGTPKWFWFVSDFIILRDSTHPPQHPHLIHLQSHFFDFHFAHVSAPYTNDGLTTVLMQNCSFYILVETPKQTKQLRNKTIARWRMPCNVSRNTVTHLRLLVRCLPHNHCAQISKCCL